MSLGLIIKKLQLAAMAQEADPYVAPNEDPDLPPTGSPTPPGDTPTDPDTGLPEPGVDPDYTAPTRIELADNKQTVIRTDADPGTWGNAYIAAELDGYDYWEIHIGSSTPNNSTLAVGVTNLDLPLNGIPGDEAGTLAYWSSGVIRTGGVDTSGFPTFGKGDKISIARDKDNGRIWFAKNGTWLGSTPAVGGAGHQGTLTGDGPYYPFTALYSAGANVTFKFASSKFAYAVPVGFYPIGQTPVTALDFSFVSSTGASSFGGTFAGMALGAADADRKIIAAINMTAVAAITISGVTIGGVAAAVKATKTGAAYTGATEAKMEHWLAAVPAGATGDVVISGTNTSASRCRVTLYRAVGLQSDTPTDVQEMNAGGTSLGVAVDAGGACVMAMADRVASSTVTLSGVTIDHGPTQNGGTATGLYQAVGSAESEAGETVTGTISGTGPALLASAWR